MRMQFLPDEPISSDDNDRLGFAEFVSLVQECVYSTSPPFVYGVLGDWGSGKTSILHLLEAALWAGFQSGQKPYVPIRFDAWKYENEADVVYPLLHEIKLDRGRRTPGLSATTSFAQAFKTVVSTSALALTDLVLRVTTKKATGEALTLDDLKKQLDLVAEDLGPLEGVLGAWADKVGELQGAFNDLLKAYAADLAATYKGVVANDVCFVILVDDLDRCLPDSAISLLESIKKYLTVERCVFVLALNPSVVYEGMRAKYKDMQIDGREYLEKILNYSFYVPEPDPENVERFAVEQLGMLVVQQRDSAKYQAWFDEFGSVLKECRFNNPRRIKRILNRYLLFISRHEDLLSQGTNGNIVRLLVVAEYFPDLFPLFLTASEQAKQKLVKMGDPDFSVASFESQSGVRIAPIYSRLSRMRDLFDLTVPADARQPSLTEQAWAVYRISRLA